MIKLQETYTLRGRAEWKYKILKREGDVVISEMYRVKDKDDDIKDCKLEGYEVFIVQKYPERPRPDGKGMIPAKELPPPDYHWGRYGHSFPATSLTKAWLQFAEDIEQQRLLMIKREKKNEPVANLILDGKVIDKMKSVKIKEVIKVIRKK